MARCPAFFQIKIIKYYDSCAVFCCCAVFLQLPNYAGQQFVVYCQISQVLLSDRKSAKSCTATCTIFGLFPPYIVRLVTIITSIKWSRIAAHVHHLYAQQTAIYNIQAAYICHPSLKFCQQTFILFVFDFHRLTLCPAKFEWLLATLT